MTGTQRKQYEMLQRVREFGNSHRDLLSTSPVATELMAAVESTIDELTRADITKLSASAAAGGGRKRDARQALVTLLQKAGKLARVLRAEGRPAPPCEVQTSRSDQALLTAGRQLAIEAAEFPEFGAHGLRPADVEAVTTAFATAAAEQGAGRAAHIETRARIDRLLRGAQRHMLRLDVIVDTLLNGDDAARAVWEQARRVQEPRAARASGEAPPPPAAEAA